MNPVGFIIDYLRWHYTTALLDIIRVWGNFLWFVGHYFSTPTLVKTFFSSWKRIKESYPAKGHFDIEYMAGTLLVNIVMRVVGMLVRTIFISVSVLLFSTLFISGVLFIAFWIIAPVGIVTLITTGINLVVGA